MPILKTSIFTDFIMIRIVLFTIIAIISNNAVAVSCVSGCNANEYSTLSGQLSKTENKVGVTKDASDITLSNRITLDGMRDKRKHGRHIPMVIFLVQIPAIMTGFILR